jgi:ABC-2 type transport system permease protein
MGTVTGEYDKRYGADNGRIVTFDDGLYGDDEGIMREMRDRDLSLLLVIAPEYSQDISRGVPGTIHVYYNQRDKGGLINSSEMTASTLLSAINRATGEKIVTDLNPSADRSFVVSPVAAETYLILKNGVHEGYTPSQLESAMTSQNIFVSIMIMMVIIMIGSILISSMGSEKENKTLETLLTLPVSRTAVVGGKIIGSAIVGLIFGAFYLLGLYIGMGSAFGAGSGNVLSDLGMSLTILDWLVVGIFLFLSIIAALGICMILGAFAKNYKAAQTLIMPITIMAMVPMFINMFTSFSALPGVLQGVMFAIPFSHPMMVTSNLMFGNTTMLIAGFAYLTLFCLVTLYITVRLYRSDILLTGFIRKKGGDTGTAVRNTILRR